MGSKAPQEPPKLPPNLEKPAPVPPPPPPKRYSGNITSGNVRKAMQAVERHTSRQKGWLLWEVEYEDGLRFWCRRQSRDKLASEGFACSSHSSAEMASRLLNEREREIEMLRGLLESQGGRVPPRYENSTDLGDC